MSTATLQKDLMPWKYPQSLGLFLYVMASLGLHFFGATGNAISRSIAAAAFIIIASCMLLYAFLTFLLFWGVMRLLPQGALLCVRVFAWIFPITFALYTAVIASNSPDTGASVFLLLGVFIAWGLVVLGSLFSALAIYAFFDKFLIRPVWHLLGRPQHPGFDGYELPTEKPPRPAQQSTQAVPPPSSNKEAAAPRFQHYDFDWKTPKTKFANLAGMSVLKQELLDAIAPMTTYVKRGPISDRNGILLSGPPGNGKSAFAMAVAGELGIPFVKVSGVDLTSKWVNESTAVLKSLFIQATEQPCVIFFDEFDSVGKDRGNSQMSEEDRKMVTALLTLIDDARKSHIVLLAATNFPENLDKALSRDGRFDFRIEVPYPDYEARVGILNGMLTQFNVKAAQRTIEYVANLWERRSVAFIESTAKRLRDSPAVIRNGEAAVDDFKAASRAASRKEGNIPKAGPKLSEMALSAAVRTEANSLIYRLNNWETIAEQGGAAPSGILLYGPPGTGKTSFVNALARELGAWHVFEVNATDVLRDPRKFSTIVQLAADHRPAIVFIDEADELLRDRTHSNSAGATNEILKSMDGLMGKVPEVLFIAATNNADAIDPAALRGGRFAEKIYMGELTGQDLVEFIGKELTAKSGIKLDGVTAESLAHELGQASPSCVISVIRKAINYTFSDGATPRPVTMDDVKRAISSTQINAD